MATAATQEAISVTRSLKPALIDVLHAVDDLHLGLKATHVSGVLVAKILMRISSTSKTENISSSLLEFGKRMLEAETKREEIAHVLYVDIVSPLKRHLEIYNEQIDIFLHKATENAKKAKVELKDTEALRNKGKVSLRQLEEAKETYENAHKMIFIGASALMRSKFCSIASHFAKVCVPISQMSNIENKYADFSAIFAKIDEERETNSEPSSDQTVSTIADKIDKTYETLANSKVIFNDLVIALDSYRNNLSASCMYGIEFADLLLKISSEQPDSDIKLVYSKVFSFFKKFVSRIQSFVKMIETELIISLRSYLKKEDESIEECKDKVKTTISDAAAVFSKSDKTDDDKKEFYNKVISSYHIAQNCERKRHCELLGRLAKVYSGSKGFAQKGINFVPKRMEMLMGLGLKTRTVAPEKAHLVKGLVKEEGIFYNGSSFSSSQLNQHMPASVSPSFMNDTFVSKASGDILSSAEDTYVKPTLVNFKSGQTYMPSQSEKSKNTNDLDEAKLKNEISAIAVHTDSVSVNQRRKEREKNIEKDEQMRGDTYFNICDTSKSVTEEVSVEKEKPVEETIRIPPNRPPPKKKQETTNAEETNAEQKQENNSENNEEKDQAISQRIPPKTSPPIRVLAKE